MLALPQLKALRKEHNLYRCYINKDEAIALLLEKGIITTTDLYQPKDETKKARRDDNLIVGDEEYEGTPGLWELISSKQPDANVYSRDDFENYDKIMVDTSALKQNNNPAEAVPKSSRGWKWKKLLRRIWKDSRQYEDQGIGTTVVIPSDPDASHPSSKQSCGKYWG